MNSTSIYDWDVNVFRAIHIGWHSAFLDPIFFFFTCLGDGIGASIVCLLFLISQVTRRYFWPLITSLAVGGIGGADLIKELIPRDRPSLLPWAHPQEDWRYHSFPSGHTTSAFAVAVTLTLLTRGTPRAWWGPFALGVACCVGLSRMYRGVHWPTDVIGGVLCGTAFGILTFMAFRAAGYRWEALPPTPAESELSRDAQ